MNKTLRTIATVVCVLLFLPLSAQERTDTTYTFRFVPGDDMFYVPFHGNDKELARLEECVARYKAEILGGKIPLRMDGHCSIADDSLARVRSNRVKSELIVRQGLTEGCFITRNHAASGDYVTVRLTVKVQAEDQAPSTPPDGGVEDTPGIRTEDTYINKVEETQAEEVQAQPAQTEQAAPAETMEVTGSLPMEEVGGAGAAGVLCVRANLLRWATLTPDLGIEWRINPSWGILVNGSWTSWSWNDKDRRYALWEVMPEVRRYMGKEKRGYLGAMYKAGQFNYKFSATGKQGDLMGGGITGGYQLRLNDALSLNFSVAVGCLHADYEKYTVIDGVRVRRGTETKNWWGPVNAGVTLVWKIY